VAKHLCGNRRCLAFDHIVEGSQKENVAEGWRAGRKHVKRRLTAEDALAIFRAGGTHAEIASRFGVSRVHVANIKNFVRWADVTLGVS
jgi:hypothetical protein